MFDIVRNNKRIVQIFLALITLPFAFWGVDSYVRNAEVGAAVATVGSVSINQQEMQVALREQQDRLRAQTGGKVDPAMLETAEARRAVLDSLVSQRLIAEQARVSHLSVGNEQLAAYIASVPSLQENGKFSKQRYEAVVASQGLSKEMFEYRLRQDMAMQQLMVPVSDAGINSRDAGLRWLAMQLEQREVAQATLLPDAYAGQVKLDAAAAQAYYDANRKRFELPEQVRVEYVQLSRDAMVNQIEVGEEEVAAAYRSRADRYRTPEMRRASHILIMVAKDAPAAQVDAAKAKAEELRVQLGKSPGEFARLASQHSQDTVSAAKGGDLDWFGRGAMVKPFEDAVFALKEGETSAVIRSDFGFHIVRVTGVRKEQGKALAEARSEIVAEIKREQGLKKYSEAAEAFGNTVYEQSDSLKPAAEKWRLAVAASGWLARGGRLPPPFDNAKLAAALFGDDALKNRRNTEAVEVAPGLLVSARVVEHKPATLQSFDSVRADIEKRLVREEAIKLAARDGEEKLARLAKGEALALTWSPARGMSRAEAQTLPSDVARAIFRADTAKLPSYGGAALPGAGYALFRITAVTPSAAPQEDPRGRALAQQYARAVAEEEFAAWMATLKQKHPVKFNKAAFETRER